MDLTSIKIIFPKTDRKYKPHKNNICTYLPIVDDYIDKLNAGHCLHNDRKDKKI